MSWGKNNKSNNPWGAGPSGPSGGGGNSGGGGGNGGPNAPDFEAVLRQAQEQFQRMFGGGNGGGAGPDSSRLLGLVVMVLVGLWFSTGIYKVEPEEQGVILRFGAYHRLADPGLNYHLPLPLERVIKVPVTTIERVEVGTRTAVAGRSGQAGRNVPEESLMLTGDENIVDIDFEVQWKVRDPSKFLFSVREPEATVKSVAESAMREVVGRTPIAKVLTEGRASIETEARTIMQQVLDNYGAGIDIVRLQMREVQPPSAVIDAFRDVQTARADRERARNEAETYRNDIIPRARGEAARILQEAEAYQQQVVARAEGEAGRFVSVVEKYKLAKDVTRRRLYLETMEDTLKGMNKIIIDRKAAGGMVPYLPLNELKPQKEKAAGQ